MGSKSIALLVTGLVLAAAAAHAQQNAPAATAMEAVAAPGLPAIGKWMIAPDGTIAHWLGEVHEGRRLREPINVILVDAAAESAEDAKRRLFAAATAAGYPVRIGHSTGYRAAIGGQTYAQVPAGHDEAFSNHVFEVGNNHGRFFGPHATATGYVWIGAFSREKVRPLRSPEHGYASFTRARDDVAQNLDRKTIFKASGFVDLANTIAGDPETGTGDHDGRAVLLRTAR